MVNSLAAVKNGAECCSLVEWKEFFRSKIESQLDRKQSLRDPLKRTSFRECQILAVYGYFISDFECSLVYYWDWDLKSINWSKIEQDTARNDMIEFGVKLGSIHSKKPNLKRAIEFLLEELDHDCPTILDTLSKKNIYWTTHGSMKYACIYEDSREDGGVEHKSSSGLLECLAFHHDYFRYRSPVWNAVPMRYLFLHGPKNKNFFQKVLLHPRCFNPAERENTGAFLWPWQRCIVGNGGRDIAYRSLSTVSLVFDLRKSTIALEQLRSRDLGEFSPFIKSVVEGAKDCILRHGGFFDKETGDGIVGHFSGFGGTDSETPFKPASQRAFDAAVDLVRATTLLCNGFQRELRLGVENLGGAVGLHAGEAVWIVEDNQVRAVGDSVILAARLCSEAPSKSIFLSNSLFVELAKQIGPEIAAQFSRRYYSGKEVKEGAGLYGYCLPIEDLV